MSDPRFGPQPPPLPLTEDELRERLGGAPPSVGRLTDAQIDGIEEHIARSVAVGLYLKDTIPSLIAEVRAARAAPLALDTTLAPRLPATTEHGRARAAAPGTTPDPADNVHEFAAKTLEEVLRWNERSPALPAGLHANVRAACRALRRERSRT